VTYGIYRDVNKSYVRVIRSLAPLEATEVKLESDRGNFLLALEDLESNLMEIEIGLDI